MSAVFTCEAVEGGGEGGGDDEKEVVVSVMRRMEGGGDGCGGGGGGGRATGTQERGSKQGEALTSACLTFETEREKGTAKTGRGGAQRFGGRREERRDRNGKKRDKQQGEKSTGRGEKKQCANGGISGRCSLTTRHRGAAKHSESHSQSCGWQSGGCGERPPPCRSGCVPFASRCLCPQVPPPDAYPATALAAKREREKREGESKRGTKR